MRKVIEIAVRIDNIPNPWHPFSNLLKLEGPWRHNSPNKHDPAVELTTPNPPKLR